MAKYLAWSCLGISNLEPLDSVDSPSVFLSYLLYSLFLIMVAILLVNMMIALLSNTYQRVEVKIEYFDRIFTLKMSFITVSFSITTHQTQLS